jgi:two-component system response regulator GlrR
VRQAVLARPLVVVNCAAIPEALSESELFGHEKGAFTGTQANREGMFRAANGSTLLLDEIGDAPRHVRLALLR